MLQYLCGIKKIRSEAKQIVELWFTEKQTEDMAISCRVLATVHAEKTPFQELGVLDTSEFGRMLVLDGVIQTTIKDEFVYHEMITHVPLNTHKNPQEVLVIGGGDGGSIREIIKHPEVKKAVLCEIDGQVIEAAKKYLPELSFALGDQRVEVILADGIKHVKEHSKHYDIVIVDSTDPIGPAVGLFELDFYKSIFHALKDDGLFVAQSESPFFNAKLIRDIYQNVSGIFPITRLYLACVPTYPGGLWSFTMGSKKYNPLEVNIPSTLPYPTRYYNREIHKTAFTLPSFVIELLK